MLEYTIKGNREPLTGDAEGEDIVHSTWRHVAVLKGAGRYLRNLLNIIKKRAIRGRDPRQCTDI